jgi:hypothetical protein
VTSDESLTWVSHPNAALRLRLADYVGRGFAIDALDESTAVVSKPKRWARPTYLLVNPFVLLNLARRDRIDRVYLSVDAAGEVHETRV